MTDRPKQCGVCRFYVPEPEPAARKPKGKRSEASPQGMCHLNPEPKGPFPVEHWCGQFRVNNAHDPAPDPVPRIRATHPAGPPRVVGG